MQNMERHTRLASFVGDRDFPGPTHVRHLQSHIVSGAHHRLLDGLNLDTASPAMPPMDNVQHEPEYDEPCPAPRREYIRVYAADAGRPSRLAEYEYKAYKLMQVWPRGRLPGAPVSCAAKQSLAVTVPPTMGGTLFLPAQRG